MCVRQKNALKFAVLILILALTSCDKDLVSDSKNIQFRQPVKVNVNGYDDHIMEPFLSRDGTVLFFNNLNQSGVNTNLHYASRVNDSTFNYSGELEGVNSDYLDGVPSMDGSNTFFFVSTRNYDLTYSTIYFGNFQHGIVSDISLVEDLSMNIAGWLNFDAEISKDGNFLYFVDGRFDANGGPYESDLVLAERDGDTFQRTDLRILENINTNSLEYAACISSDMLELYFTRVEASIPQIFVATRNAIEDPFNRPYKIKEITGFVEAPTISADDSIIYFHKFENEKFVLYMVRKE